MPYKLNKHLITPAKCSEILTISNITACSGTIAGFLYSNGHGSSIPGDISDSFIASQQGMIDTTNNMY